jgi:hypothetical protein
MSTSNRKRNANRVNGQRSRGPIDTSSTRYNATKHGLLANGLTELDNADGYETVLHDLKMKLQPEGVIEEFLVQSVAIDIVRVHRARRLEAEYITSQLYPPILGPAMLDTDALIDGQVIDPGLPAAINDNGAQRLVDTYQRYESILLRRIHTSLHELERRQRMRAGENVPAPHAFDVTVQMTNATTERKAADAILPGDQTHSQSSDAACSAGEVLASSISVRPGLDMQAGQEELQSTGGQSSTETSKTAFCDSRNEPNDSPN